MDPVDHYLLLLKLTKIKNRYETLKGNRGLQLDNRKVFRAPSPRTKFFERLFYRLINCVFFAHFYCLIILNILDILKFQIFSKNIFIKHLNKNISVILQTRKSSLRSLIVSKLI